MSKISKDEEMYSKALMLAIQAPDEEKAKECISIAHAIGQRLTAKQRDLARKGVEVAVEFSNYV